jgi:3-dehydroquinate dehydratase-2
MNILVLHGPNLNLLGERSPEIYGSQTLDQVNTLLRERGDALGATLRCVQSNHEGVLIDTLHAERRWMHGLILNGGALTHYSYALRDAVEAVKVRAVEVHLSNIHAREPWRRVSVTAEVCEAQIVGKGVDGYLEALERLCERP